MPTPADVSTAVMVRPHYEPCDVPDNPCSCGADGDRRAIAQALADVRAELTDQQDSGYEALRAGMKQEIRQAEEHAVFDFLNWLAPQNIWLVEWSSGNSQPEGALWERWRRERNLLTGPGDTGGGGQTQGRGRADDPGVQSPAGPAAEGGHDPAPGPAARGDVPQLPPGGAGRAPGDGSLGTSRGLRDLNDRQGGWAR